jgi:hypothetical protein
MSLSAGFAAIYFYEGIIIFFWLRGCKKNQKIMQQTQLLSYKGN